MLQFYNPIEPNRPNPLVLVKEIRMEVVFGTPSQNCIGSGICMVMSRLPSIQPLRCPHAAAWISYAHGQLRFRFSKSEVEREDAVRRFDSPWFLVRESFQISRYTARRLGMASPWISPGVFPIIETDKDWILTFPLLTKCREIAA